MRFRGPINTIRTERLTAPVNRVTNLTPSIISPRSYRAALNRTADVPYVRASNRTTSVELVMPLRSIALIAPPLIKQHTTKRMHVDTYPIQHSHINVYMFQYADRQTRVIELHVPVKGSHPFGFIYARKVEYEQWGCW